MPGLRLVKRIKVNCCRSRSIAGANNADIYVAAVFANGESVRRKLDQAGGLRRRRIEFAEQTVLFFSCAGAEIKRVDVAAGPTVPKSESPQLVDCDSVAVFVLYCAEERAVRWVVGMDAGITLAKVAHQECAAEDAKTSGRKDYPPRGIECAVVNTESQITHPVGVEPANEAIAD